MAILHTINRTHISIYYNVFGQLTNSYLIILDPYRKFKIFVKAYNTKNEGNASEDIQVKDSPYGLLEAVKKST